MKTKAQERAALEKIRQIVEELGESSYVGMALEGCFEIAEENIENDWGCSLLQRAQAAEKKITEYANKIASLQQSEQKLKAEYSALTRESAEKNDEIKRWKERSYELDGKIEELNNQLDDVTDDLADAKDTIIHLKAKLYDMITVDI